MKTEAIQFNYDPEQNIVTVVGCPLLENCEGYAIGEGMAILRRKLELFVVNMKSGNFRRLVSEYGTMDVSDEEIDFKAIEENCEHGMYNAQNRLLRYGGLGRWSDFNGGLCAFCWTLYPDGEYFADSGGFGMEDNEEVVIYGILDKNLKLIEPFRPIRNIEAYLEEKRDELKGEE